jgi:hypothetical protein
MDLRAANGTFRALCEQARQWCPLGPPADLLAPRCHNSSARLSKSINTVPILFDQYPVEDRFDHVTPLQQRRNHPYEKRKSIVKLP